MKAARAQRAADPGSSGAEHREVAPVGDLGVASWRRRLEDEAFWEVGRLAGGRRPGRRSDTERVGKVLGVGMMSSLVGLDPTVTQA